ncbi:MAG: sigma factor [Evtepia gabavorous]
MIQEGMLGLLSAIREFRSDRGARFRTFAELCVRRRIISVVQRRRRKAPHR